MKVSIHLAVVLVFGWGVVTFGQSQPASRPTTRPTSLPTSEHGRFVSLPTGVLFLPNTLKTPVESIDLLVFFHGAPGTVARNFTEAGLLGVAVMVNYGGLSAAYSRPFQDPELFGSILEETMKRLIEEKIVRSGGRWNRLCAASFSAGYGAIREILKSPEYFKRIDAIYLADSLYAGYVSDTAPRKVNPTNMTDFRRFAKEAVEGRKTFIFSHTYLAPGTYAGTFETADDLIEYVGAARTIVTPVSSETLPRVVSRCDKGRFHVYGCEGTDGEAHMQHLRYNAKFLAELPTAQKATASQPAR